MTRGPDASLPCLLCLPTQVTALQTAAGSLLWASDCAKNVPAPSHLTSWPSWDEAEFSYYHQFPGEKSQARREMVEPGFKFPSFGFGGAITAFLCLEIQAESKVQVQLGLVSGQQTKLTVSISFCESRKMPSLEHFCQLII